MARDTSLALRQAVVRSLRADADLIAIVPEERNYGMRSPPEPSYPFTRYGSPDAVPFLGQCIDGARISFTVHSFSQQQYEDECANINAAVAGALDQAVFDLGASAKAHVRWVGSQIVPDAAEADVWHGINRFEGTVVS
jgi:hypothetical protein